MSRQSTRRVWLFASALIAACASTPIPRVDDARLARLPPAEREALINRNREIDIARSNVETAKVALQDAQQFRSIVENERAAARESRAGAQKSVELTTRTGGANRDGVAAAQSEERLASQRLDAANAKLQYAENLVALRSRQVDLRQGELDLTRANLELERYDRLAAANEASGLARQDFLRARDEAQQVVAERRSGVETSRTAVLTSQRAWNELHQEVNTARRSASDTSTEAPLPPQPID